MSSKHSLTSILSPLELNDYVAIDLETTGLNPQQDRITEIAACRFIGGEKKEIYTTLINPGIPVPKNIVEITGITDDMVKGHSIDWNNVQTIFEKSQLIVAHNASFDRSFTDKKIDLSKNKIWACSINDIDWDRRDFIYII